MGIAARAPPAPARRGICWKAAGSIVVITDVVMPKMSGIELITKIKDRFGSDVAVIVVTAVNDRDSAMHALEKGAYQYMNKPFKHNELLVAVAAALQRRQIELEVNLNVRRLQDSLHKQCEQSARTEKKIALQAAIEQSLRAGVADTASRPSSVDVAGRAHALVQSKYASSDCNTTSIATELGVSGSRLCHCYRKHWGTTIGRDLRVLRIVRARELLETTDLLLKEVAAKSGFLKKSYRAFMNTFIVHTGMTPELYRRVARQTEATEAVDRSDEHLRALPERQRNAWFTQDAERREPGASSVALPENS